MILWLLLFAGSSNGSHFRSNDLSPQFQPYRRSHVTKSVNDANPLLLTRHPSYSRRALQYEDVRGGGGRQKRRQPWKKRSSSLSVASPPLPSTSPFLARIGTRQALTAAATVATVLVAYHYRHAWTPFLDKQVIQDKTLSILQHLKSDDDTNAWLPLLLYSAGLTAWEFLGLSTIPIETAAGHVFGFEMAVIASFAGKLAGASMCYALGQQMVPVESLRRNKYFSRLLDSSTSNSASEQKHHPFWTALLLKFSVFPEAIKNVGSAALGVSFAHFCLATLLQGGTFTVLWSHLGSHGSNSAWARPILASCVVIGFVLSPLNLAWWMRSLQRKGGAKTSARRTTERPRLPVWLVRAMDSPWSLVGVWLLTIAITVATPLWLS